MNSSRPSRWIFSRTIDLWTFLGSALLSLFLLVFGSYQGVLFGETPDWAWIPGVLLIDVAHVYATGFRVYFDKQEWKRRPWLYTLVPILGLWFGIMLYSEDPLWFWCPLAYLAVFHFIRQQYGFLVLYRARNRETGRVGYWIDTLAIYAASVYPLLYWHIHLPRNFDWFLPGDFFSLPWFSDIFFAVLYWLIMGVYLLRSFRRYWKKDGSPGKDILVISTAVCWYVGIITFNSDYAFTVTNVFIHGIPYLVLIWWYGRKTNAKKSSLFLRLALSNFAIFLALLWALSYLEELVWDRAIWHERAWLFGSFWDVGQWEIVLVPLLALPQLTHYILEGFLWKRKENPKVKEVFDLG